MAVYVWLNGSAPPHLARLRHLDAWCLAGGMDRATFVEMRRLHRSRSDVPVWRLGNGAEFAYVPNSARLRERTLRCPACFVPGGPLPSAKRWDGWRHALSPGVGVYEICWLPQRITQIGSGDLFARVGARFRATFYGRFDRVDSMWWVYDLLSQGQRPEVSALPLDGRSPGDAERDHKDLRLSSGWQVSSAV